MRRLRRLFRPAVPRKSSPSLQHRWTCKQPGLGILRSLGVYGYEAIEDGYLAALVLSEPVLLIGDIGSGKTMLAEKTAQALEATFCAYDASKAVFEDVLGFPDPTSFSEGKVRYIPTPLSIHDKEFVLVDEVSRAPLGMQNKWLEIIHSRRIMGMPLPKLKYVVAAMNPPNAGATMPLDPAFAGRFTFVLQVPKSEDLSREHRLAIITNVRPGTVLTANKQQKSEDLRNLLAQARSLLPEVEHDCSETASKYSEAIWRFFNCKETQFDGRRAGMLYRAILGVVAVRRAAQTLSPEEQVPFDLLRHVLEMTLPYKATDTEVSLLDIRHAHEFAVAALRGESPPLLLRKSLARDVVSFVKQEEKAWSDRDALSKVVTRIISSLQDSNDVQETLDAACALMLLMRQPQAQKRLAPTDVSRLWAILRDLIRIDPDAMSEFFGQYDTYNLGNSVTDGTRNLILRLSFTLAKRLEADSDISVDVGEFAKALVNYLEEGERI